jgi:hypothetical protein
MIFPAVETKTALHRKWGDMAKRVEKIFDEIKTLSKEEQREPLHLLPKALQVTPEDHLWTRLAESRPGPWDCPRS